MRRLYKGVASQVVMLKAYLSSDHVSAATGKTIALVISKNGAAFGNPNAGATNATEVSNGWYKVTLDDTDTNTNGDLVVRGTSSGVDDVERVCVVEDTIPSVAAGANGGLPKIDANLELPVSTLRTNNDKTGYALTAAYDAAKTAAAATDIVSGGAITTSGGLASADTKKMNGLTVNGSGTAGDLWRGA